VVHVVVVVCLFVGYQVRRGRTAMSIVAVMGGVEETGVRLFEASRCVVVPAHVNAYPWSRYLVPYLFDCFIDLRSRLAADC